MIVIALRVSFWVGKMGEMGEGGYIACACELRGRGSEGEGGRRDAWELKEEGCRG